MLGVPQGYNLNSLLFLIFTNDIVNVFNNSNCLLYADDCKFFREIKTLVESTLLQRDLDGLTSVNAIGFRLMLVSAPL